MPPRPDRNARWRRLAWFVALWLAGVATIGLVTLALRLAIAA